MEEHLPILRHSICHKRFVFLVFVSCSLPYVITTSSSSPPPLVASHQLWVLCVAVVVTVVAVAVAASVAVAVVAAVVAAVVDLCVAVVVVVSFVASRVEAVEVKVGSQKVLAPASSFVTSLVESSLSLFQLHSSDVSWKLILQNLVKN